MTATLFAISAFLLLCLCLSPPAQSAQHKRVALVIGNSAYRSTPRLDNPRNDATDIAAALQGLGFNVITGTDLDKSGMDRIVRRFADALKGARVGLFFYAGHGLQVNGRNYLVPVDARLDSESSLDFEMIELGLVQRVMERATRTNIVILDACRDNPLARNLARSLGTRSAQVGRGLASVESGEGTLISFSTQPGNVALDGEGRNSPFAAAFLRHVTAPGDDLSTILINVRTDVMEATERRQVPWEHSALTSRYYFSQAKPGEAEARELKLWDEVRKSTHPADIERYLRAFPHGAFAALARRLADALKAEAAAGASERSREAEQAAELARAREEVKRARAEVERVREQASGNALAMRGGPQPSAEFPFDGRWNFEIKGGKFCPRKSHSGIWPVARGQLPNKGKGPAQISASGDVVYITPSALRPAMSVKFIIHFLADTAKGTYRVQGGRCTGTIQLSRQ